MSHIAVDLKVIEVHAPAVARTLEEPVAVTLGGLNLLWHRCWSTKSATITRIGLAGIFGMERIDLRIEALIDAGFLTRDGDAFRVRGAEKYLRIREGNSKGGHAAKGNLRKGDKPGPKPEGEPGTEPGVSREGAGTKPGKPPGSIPALTPSTEHRAPSTNDVVGAPPVAAFEVEQPDTSNIESWSKEEFWRAAELVRRAEGYPPQKWPNPLALKRWWGEARAQCDVSQLATAFERFVRDKYAMGRAPPAPFELFMTNWNNHLPRRSA